MLLADGSSCERSSASEAVHSNDPLREATRHYMELRETAARRHEAWKSLLEKREHRWAKKMDRSGQGLQALQEALERSRRRARLLKGRPSGGSASSVASTDTGGSSRGLCSDEPWCAWPEEPIYKSGRAPRASGWTAMTPRPERRSKWSSSPTAGRVPLEAQVES